ncbi:MAG: hypothetical protein RBQ97_07815 [Acholeplasma sp.]|nr:hypothetical protein [Acholeplasma sp.]
MIVTISDVFDIEIDSIGNHTLIENTLIKSGINKGQPSRIIHGYFINISGALKKYLNIASLKASDRLSISEYLETYQRLLNEVTLKFKDISK